MKRQAAEAEGEAAEIGLLASRRNGPSQQINAPTINTTTADVCGSTADPVKGGEKELGIQDEENRKSKGTLPVINWSAGSKDSIQDETKSDTYISNYDETTGHERDELKEADLETGNKRVPATFGKQTSKQLRSSHKRRRSLESKERELGDDNHITKGDELKVFDHLETENKRVPSSSDLEETERGIQNDGEFNLEDEENLKSKGTVPVINGSEGSKDLLQDQTDQKDTYINNNDETTGHDHRDDNYITEGDELKEADHVETQNKRVPFWRKLIAYRPWNSKRSSSDLERKGICGDSCCCFRVKAKPGQKRYGGGGGCDESCFSNDAGDFGGGGGGGDGGGNGGGGDYGRFEPNPGIKRPTVTVSRPPPPPPPPPTL